jgi:hypothetical protein
VCDDNHDNLGNSHDLHKCQIKIPFLDLPKGEFPWEKIKKIKDKKYFFFLIAYLSKKIPGDVWLVPHLKTVFHLPSLKVLADFNGENITFVIYC